MESSRHTIRVLMVDTSSSEWGQVFDELRLGNLDPKGDRVGTPEELHAALTQKPWDVIIANRPLPEFDALTALTLLQHTGLEFPFIVILERHEVEQAVQIMKAGANYVLSSENLSQLVPVVRRALDEAAVRRIRKEAEREAYRLANIVRSLDHAIIGLNLMSSITNWNPAAEKLYGWTAAEAVGRNISIIVPPERAAECSKLMARVKHGEHIECIETVRVCKDGRRVNISLTVSPIRNDQGSLIGISKSALEVRRHPPANENSPSRFHCLLNAESVAMGCWTADGSITSANNALLQLIGYSKEEVENGNVRWTEITPPEFLHRDHKALDEIRTVGYSTPYEKQYIRKDGNRVSILVGGAAFGGGVTDAGAFFAIDLTQRKKSDAHRRICKLCSTELEILKLISDGVPNKNIAVTLSLSLRTVEKYRHSLFETLGVSSAAEATRIWVLANLDGSNDPS